MKAPILLCLVGILAFCMIAAPRCHDTVCVYSGQTYEPGESFPAEDGCNTCTCMADGMVACTKMACLDQKTLCEETGGRWDEQSCGHYECGFPPACDAIIPGCDCGPGKIFDPVEGCMYSDTCACSDSDPDCPDEALCCCADGGIDHCQGRGTCIPDDLPCL